MLKLGKMGINPTQSLKMTPKQPYYSSDEDEKQPRQMQDPAPSFGQYQKGMSTKVPNVMFSEGFKLKYD